MSYHAQAWRLILGRQIQKNLNPNHSVVVCGKNTKEKCVMKKIVPKLFLFVLLLSGCNLPGSGLSDSANATGMADVLNSLEQTFVPPSQTAMAITMAAYRTTPSVTPTPFQPTILTDTPVPSETPSATSVFGIYENSIVYSVGTEHIVFNMNSTCENATMIGEGITLNGYAFSIRSDGAIEVKTEAGDWRGAFSKLCLGISINGGYEFVVAK